MRGSNTVNSVCRHNIGCGGQNGSMRRACGVVLRVLASGGVEAPAQASVNKGMCWGGRAVKRVPNAARRQ